MSLLGSMSHPPFELNHRKSTQAQNYEEYVRRLRTYLCLHDRRYAALLDWTIQQPAPVANETIRGSANTEYDVVDTGDELQPLLY